MHVPMYFIFQYIYVAHQLIQQPKLKLQIHKLFLSNQIVLKKQEQNFLNSWKFMIRLELVVGSGSGL